MSVFEHVFMNMRYFNLMAKINNSKERKKTVLKFKKKISTPPLSQRSFDVSSCNFQLIILNFRVELLLFLLLFLCGHFVLPTLHENKH